MLVKNRIKKEWFSPFGKSKNKDFYFFYSNKLNINQYSSFQDFFIDNYEINIIYILEFLFPQIQLDCIISKPLSEETFNDEDYRDGKFGIIYYGKINTFSRITSFEVEEYGFFDEKTGNHYDDITLTNQINDSIFQLHLNKFDSLNGTFSLIGNFSGDYNDYTLIDLIGFNFHAKIKVIGLLKDKNYPVWLEYIIDGVLNYENKDFKMAILNIFSAFENFISIIHDNFIFEYLALKVGKNERELKLLKNFAQDKKRLFEKAKDVITFLSLNDLESNLKRIESYEKDRHKIAHGTVKNNDLSNIDFKNMTFNIIVFILSVSIGKSLESEEWVKTIKQI